MKVRYLCLQATREGQASYSHVHEIIQGLSRRSWQVELHEPRYATATPSALRRLYEFLRVQLAMCIAPRPDIVYIRAHFAAWPAAFWYWLTRVPVVQEINGPHEDLFAAWPATRRLARLFIALSRWQYRRANGIVAVTPQLAQWVRNEGARGDVTVIGNGANTDLFCPEARGESGLPERYAVFFGALSPWQGVTTLLAAARHSSWPDGVALVIAGDGIDRAVVESAADGGRIVYVGRQPQKRLAGIVAGSLGGLVPKNDVAGHSQTGLCPLKLFEILACGVPAIVTDFPGMREVVRDDDCGRVVPSDDPGALAAAVADLARNDADRVAMGRRARDLAVRRHSWDARAGDTRDFLARVAGSPLP